MGLQYRPNKIIFRLRVLNTGQYFLHLSCQIPILPCMIASSTLGPLRMSELGFGGCGMHNGCDFWDQEREVNCHLKAIFSNHWANISALPLILDARDWKCQYFDWDHPCHGHIYHKNGGDSSGPSFIFVDCSNIRLSTSNYFVYSCINKQSYKSIYCSYFVI